MFLLKIIEDVDNRVNGFTNDVLYQWFIGMNVSFRRLINRIEMEIEI